MKDMRGEVLEKRVFERKKASSSKGLKDNCPRLRFPEFGSDWKEVKIGDILRIRHGRDYKKESNINKKYPVLGSGGIITHIDSYLCNWDCVCIGRKGTINKPIFMNTPFWAVDTLFYSKSEIHEHPKFQFYLFETINWMLYNSATGVPSLTTSVIENIKRFIPTFPEQKKIANFLTLIDKRIDKQKELIKILKKYKKGVLYKVFSNFNKWQKLEVKSIAKVKTGSSNTQDNNPKGIYPFYIRSVYISHSDKYIYDGEAVLTIGDGQIGKVYHYINGKFDCHQRVYMITDFTRVSGKYFYYFFSTFFYDRAMKMSAKNTVDSVRMDMISEMPIYFPDHKEQLRIVSTLDLVDSSIEKNNNLFNKLLNYKQGLLQKMFM